MSKIDVVRTAMNEALKAGNKPRKDALSLLLSALKDRFINKRAELTEEEENAVVLKEIKEAQEQIDTTPDERGDVIAECQNRIAVYSEFAPKLMTPGEINSVIDETLAELNLPSPTLKDKGLLMKTLMPKVKGKADGSLVNQLLSEYFGRAADK